VAKSIPKGVVGVVCRSPKETFIGASAVVFNGITHPGSLEAMACREALVTAADLQLGRVYVASDCLEVINALNGTCMGEFGNILREVCEGAALNGDTTFVHVGRSSTERRIAWRGLLRPCLVEDMCGLFIHRKV
jgi:hypothetical protein